MNSKTKELAQASMVAAMYVVLVMTFQPFSFGVVQYRIAEILCILPIFMPASIPGLFVGCLIANIAGGGHIFDIIFGSLATLYAAKLTYDLRQSFLLAILPPILINAIVVGLLLRYVYVLSDALIVLIASVMFGQLISVGGLGFIFYITLRKVLKLRIE